MNVVLDDFAQEQASQYVLGNGPRHRQSRCDLQSTSDIEDFCEQQFNPSLDSHAQDNVEQAEANDLIPFRSAPTSPGSLDTTGPCG